MNPEEEMTFSKEEVISSCLMIHVNRLPDLRIEPRTEFLTHFPARSIYLCRGPVVSYGAPVPRTRRGRP